MTSTSILMRSCFLAVLILTGMALQVVRAEAQATVPSDAGFSWGEIFDADEMLLIGGVAAGTVALHGADSLLTALASERQAGGGRILIPASRWLTLIGRPGSFLIAGGAWVAGEALDRESMAHVGKRTAAALLINEIATRGIKGIVGRSRPDLSGNPSDFRVGRGFFNSSWSSFPSGHASAAFTTAAVIQSELAYQGSPLHWPAAVVMYGTASAIGLSRIYQNRHWATDVLAGAALGYLIGENVVEYSHRGDGSTPVEEQNAARIPIFYVSIPSN